MLCRPSIPCGVIVILFHENSEKRVVLQPRGFFLAKFPKTGLPIFAGASGEIRERLLKQASFRFFDLAIFDSTTAQVCPVCPPSWEGSRRIDICQRSIKIFAR